MVYQKLLLAVLVVSGTLSLPVFGQAQDNPEATGGDEGRPTPIVGRRGRFGVYNATGSFGYSSLGESNTGSAVLGNLLADYSAVGSVSAGYESSSERGMFSLVYTPYYSRRFRWSQLSSFNQSLALSGVHRIRTRGRFTFSAQAGDSTTEQLAIFPSVLGAAASTPATSEEFAQALLGQDQSNNRLTTILLQGDAGNPATLVALFGGRVFTASGRASYDWSLSPRSRLYVSGEGSRAQSLEQAGLIGTETAYNLESTAATAVAGWSYSLSPRTTLGTGVEYHTSRSNYFNGDVAQVNFTVGRQFRRNWITSLSVGGGEIILRPHLGTVGPSNQAPTWSAAGTVGKRGRTQSLIAYLARTAGDSYGAGSSGNTMASLAWNFQRPGNTWAYSVNGGYQRLERGLFNVLTTWTLEGRASRRVSRNLDLALSFSYLDTPAQTAQQLAYPVMSGFQTRLIVLWTNRLER